MPHDPATATVLRTDRSIAWPMTVLTSLFFMWGFMTVMNDVLVPHLKKVFQLTYSEASNVLSYFFGAYFLGSLIYYLASIRGGDPIGRFGYKRGLVVGSIIAAVGSALFVPATYMHTFGAYKLAVFVLGLGFTLLQIAANPFVAVIGRAKSASSRLNLAQAFNSLGTALAPVLGGALIFKTLEGEAAVRWPYACFALLLLIQAAWVAFTDLPEPPHQAKSGDRATRHPQLRWGMVAIFCYVGAEVAIGGFMINYLGSRDVLDLPEASAKHYLSLYWGGAMTGRFLGAIALSRNIDGAKRIGYLLLAAVAMLLLLFALNATDRFLLKHFWPFAVLVLANLLAFLFAGPDPSRALGFFATAAAALLLFSIFSDGAWALWSIVAIGLFNSILWSNIFTLAIDGLKEDTSQGSSLLVMMIVGGAAIPKLQAMIADALATPTDADAGLQVSFLLPVLCYAFLAWYGFKGSKHASA